MKCPECQTENPETRKFCRKCGEKLLIICPQCDFENLPEDNFCGECGQKLDEAEEKEVPEAEGERKYVTVLFSDLSGYTAMSEKLDPEELKEITTGIFSQISKVIDKYEGFVEKFVGDAVMALFGVPKAHEDDPIRAIRAAREIHELVDSISPEVEKTFGQPISMHTGINTGLVVTGEVDMGKGTHGVAGDTINLASRLSNLAKAGEILVGPDSCRQAEGYFVFNRLEPTKLKGKTKSIVTYRVVQETKVRSRFEAAERRGFTNFTGRKQELTTLSACLEKAIAGQGQLVTVVGEAGIGKSRLLSEFRHSLDRERITVLEGRCQSYGTETPYLPMVNALRRGLNLQEKDSPNQLLEKTVANIRAIDPALESYIPHYLHLLSIPSHEFPMPQNLKGEELRSALQEALTAILTLNTRRKPMVCIFEDWHWRDEASDLALKHLVGVIVSYPLMLVVLYRPKHEARWGSLEIHTPLVLKPLGRPNTEDILKSVFCADRIPGALRDMIHERTGGNPLFIEEVSNSLLEQGVVLVQNRQVALTRSEEDLHLPDTVQAVISSRIDQLNEKVQETLRLASVIGREFERSILERITPDPQQLSKPLEELKALEVIQQTRVLPEAEYIFKHVLTQVVVYDRLLLRRRKELHGLVGQAIEELYADRIEERAGILAYHYARSEHQDKAVKYALLAGDQAAALYANTEATTYFEQALTKARALTASPKAQRWQIDATLKLAAVGITRQDIERDLTNLEQAHALTEAMNDETRLSRVLYWLGRIHYVLLNSQIALKYAKQSLEIADRLGDDVLAGPPVNLMGRLYWAQSEFVKAAQMMERSVEQMQQVGNKTEESTAAAFAGYVLAQLGEFDRALHYADHSIQLGREIQNPFAESAAYHFRGIDRDQRGEWAQAIKDYEGGRRIADRAGDLFRVYLIKFWEGRAHTLNGDPSRGRVLLEESLTLAENIGTKFGLSMLKIFFADCLLKLGKLDAALSFCQEAIHLAEETGDRFINGLAHRTLCEIISYTEPSDAQKAERAILEAIRIQQEISAKPELARSYMSYANWLERKGDKEKARDYLTKAIGMFQQMSMAWDLVKSEEILRKL
jgi:class 3 adenylate cyclase/tetratricopeptide (TPR) repeat protein